MFNSRKVLQILIHKWHRDFNQLVNFVEQKQVYLSKKSSFLPNFFSVSFLAILIIHVWNHSPDYLLEHDLSAWVSSSNQFLSDRTLYSSFFNINPPFLLIFYILFGQIFGFAILGLKALNTIFILLHFLLLHKILIKIENRIIAFLTFNFVVTLAFTRNIYQMFLPSESLGTLLSLTALFICTKLHLTRLEVYSVGCLIALATQTKETYAFTILFALFACLKQKKSRTVKLFDLLVSYLFTTFLIFAFLYFIKELDNYLDVLDLKNDRFRIPDWKNSIHLAIIFLFRQMEIIGISAVIIIFLLSLVAIRKLVTSSRSKHSFQAIMSTHYIPMLLFIHYLGILFGLFWGNRDFSAGHVAITFLFPFMLFISSFITFIVRIASIAKSIKIIICSLFFFTFAHNAILHNFYKPNVESRSLSRATHNYRVINDLQLNEKSCIQQAYGWNSGQAYFYTNMKPCSKYFLLNLIIFDDRRLFQLKKDLVNNPPQAIIYETLSGPDLDWKHFEKYHFPYQVVLENCYHKAVDSDVYLAKFKRDSQQKCLMKFSEIKR